MKNKHLLFFAALFALAGSVRADVVLRVGGEVKETCVVAVPARSLYSAATPGRENALAAELRVHEDREPIPYVLRQQLIRRQVVRTAVHTLKITKVDDKDRLVIEAELPRTDRKDSRFSRIEIDTPLKDFEQLVTVKVGNEVKATGAICDYSRFATFRRTAIPAALPRSGRLTISFARPVTEVEAAQFERTISENADGVEAKSVRRAVEERPFRIDSIRVTESWNEFVFEAAPAEERDVHAEITRNAESKTTTLDFETCGMPVTAVGICTKDENFSRTARVLVRRNYGWSRIAEGRFKVINLPGKQEKSLMLTLGREIREPEMRIELDDGDNPAITFEERAVMCKVVPYDIVFIAKPGPDYQVRVECGAELPHYDQVVREYITEVKDPVRLNFKTVLKYGNYGRETRSTYNPIPLISLAVFVLLAFVCFWLFKSTGKN